MAPEDQSPRGSSASDEASPNRARPTLSDVIRALESEVLRVVRTPEGAGTSVSDVVILDPTDPHGLPPGCIVLGVGLSRREGEVLTVVERVGEAGAAALVLRTDEDLAERVLEGAEKAGVALLTVPPEMTWGQLYSLLRTASVSAGAVGGADAAGVPVGDLFALADAIAGTVGGPVTIEDPHWRVLAYANLDYPIDEARRQTILGRTPPTEWRGRLDEAGVAGALRSGDVVRFEGYAEEGLAPRTAAPVRAGTELLGSVWVAEGGEPLGEEAKRALLRFADVAAIHLICHRASEDVTRRTRGAFVREVLEGRVPVASEASEVPFRADEPFTVLAFEPVAGESAARAGHQERVLGVISLYCEDAHPHAMCALVRDRFWALLPTPRARARESTLALARRIVERVEETTAVRLCAGVGTSVPRVRDVPRSRRAAEQALAVLEKREGDARVVHIDEVRAHAVLLELLDLAAERPGLVQGKLDDLIAHDRDHGTSYLPTLRDYLDCSRDAGLAAKRQGVHPNTLRYRVRRLAELSGLDLGDPDERLVTELQLRLIEHDVPSDRVETL